jgi:hypothetical protein
MPPGADPKRECWVLSNVIVMVELTSESEI